jgi:hypothetical protein
MTTSGASVSPGLENHHQKKIKYRIANFLNPEAESQVRLKAGVGRRPGAGGSLTFLPNFLSY